MIAGPVSPGVGRPVYQPARAKLSGTSRVPSRLRPSGSTGATAPTAGMSTRTGREAARGPGELTHGPRSGCASRAGTGTGRMESDALPVAGGEGGVTATGAATAGEGGAGERAASRAGELPSRAAGTGSRPPVAPADHSCTPRPAGRSASRTPPVNPAVNATAVTSAPHRPPRPGGNRRDSRSTAAPSRSWTPTMGPGAGAVGTGPAGWNERSAGSGQAVAPTACGPGRPASSRSSVGQVSQVPTEYRYPAEMEHHCPPVLLPSDRIGQLDPETPGVTGGTDGGRAGAPRGVDLRRGGGGQVPPG